MAQEDVRLSGTFLDSAGNALANKTVTLFSEGTVTPALTTDTTDSAGEWDFTRTLSDLPGRYDVQLVNGTQTYRILSRDKFQVTELQARNPTTAQSALSAYSTTSEAASLVATFGFRPATESSGVETGDTPSDGDLGYIDFTLSNDHSDKQEWITARIAWEGADVSDGSEDGQFNFWTMTAGTLVEELHLNGAALWPETDAGLDLGTSALGFNDLHLGSGGVINLDGGDVTLTHSSNTLTVAGGTFATAALTTSTIVASGIVKTDDSTDATSTTDGSLQTDGGLSVVLDAVVGNDLHLLSDSAVFNMGAGSDFSITHDGTTGATLAGNPIEIDSGGNITLDAHTGIFIFQDANTEILRITESGSGDVTIKLETNAKDLIFTDNGDATGLTIKDAAAGIVVPGEVMTTKISYTDGDDAITIADGGGITLASTLTATASLQIRTIDYSDGDLAITIADGGGITAAAGITSTAAANTLGATSFNDASITNVNDIALDSISADGTDINVAVSDNSATALTIKQGSDAYLIVDTANSSESVSIGTGISGTVITLGHSTSEVTVADNLTVTGDLTVSGATTTVDTATLTVTDPLIKLAQGTTASPAVDLGIIFTRGNGSSTDIANRAILWDESADVFAFANTNDEAGTTTGNVDIDDYAAIHVGAITADDTSVFSGSIELGHATDTTIARSGSGAITVEGTAVLLAGDALTGTTIDATTDFTIGDTVITDGVITDTSGLQIAAAVDLVANTLTTTGSLQVRTIDYSDGDLAMTIADGGGVTFAQDVTTATDKNVVLGDGANVSISTPLLANADHTTTGITAEMLAGGAISAFDLVCVHTTTQEVLEADASAYATARVIGIAPAAISDTATGTILLHGFIRDDTWTWTTGSTLYLSETAGAMTHTAPTTDGAFVQVVGVALSPDVVYFNPSMDVIEHA